MYVHAYDEAELDMCPFAAQPVQIQVPRKRLHDAELCTKYLLNVNLVLACCCELSVVGPDGVAASGARRTALPATHPRPTHPRPPRINPSAAPPLPAPSPSLITIISSSTISSSTTSSEVFSSLQTTFCPSTYPFSLLISSTVQSTHVFSHLVCALGVPVMITLLLHLPLGTQSDIS